MISIHFIYVSRDVFCCENSDFQSIIFMPFKDLHIYLFAKLAYSSSNY